jgi:hypothetical protein
VVDVGIPIVALHALFWLQGNLDGRLPTLRSVAGH